MQSCRKNGYLTVYLSLILSVLLSFVLSLVEGARISATSMKSVCVADIAINSTFSEYNKALLDRYDLIFIDSTYCSGNGGIEAVRSHLNNYLYMNLDEGTPALTRDLLGMKLDSCEIEDFALATDNCSEALLRQVSDYMNTTLEGKVLSCLEDLTGDLSAAHFDYDVEGKRSEVQSQLDAVEPPRIINEEGEEEEIPINNPADTVNSIRGCGILGMVLNDTSSISQTKVDTSQYCSNRSLYIGNGISDEERQLGKSAGKLTYNEYLFDKFGYYSHERDNSLLSYQIEYAIKAKDNDWDNLEAVCRTIALWREAINFFYLSTDAEKKSQAELIADGLAIITYCPELKDPIMWSILLAWSYVETLQDMKILLEGGGVPPYKSAQTWHTSITSIFHPRSALQSYPNQEGPKYGDYLKTMLIMTSFSKILNNSLDIYEMDIRLTPGNQGFKLDFCVQSFSAYIVTDSTHGHKTYVRRRSGYYYA